MATVIEIEPAELSILEECEVSLDALNFLGKRMDGMSKGCAHTYALKYYLFEKFSIDQGEDDPDNFDRSATGKATPPRLSNAQMQRLYKKGDLCGMDAAAVNARILQKYNKQDPAAITIDEYNAICASLDNYYAQMTAANNQGGNQQC